MPSRDVVIGIVGEPGSLLPDDPVGAVVAAAVFEPLVARTATEDLEPRLVEAVPSFANGGLALLDDGTDGGRLVATFRLRSGLTWQDGEPLTADDVVFAFEHDRAAGTASRSVADRMARVEAIDARTFRVAYRAGERWESYALAPRVLPRHLLERGDPAQLAQYASRPVHAGPYRVARRAPGVIELEAFADHVGGPPRIPRIEVRVYSDRSALLTAVRGGEVDVAPSPGFDASLAATLDRSVDASGYTVRYTQAQAVATLRFGPRLADPLVREAISRVIDRERLARAVFGGRVLVPSSYLVAPLWAAAEPTSVHPLDTAGARALLAKAGSVRSELGIAQLNGDRMLVTLVVPSAMPALAEAARGVAVDLGVLGIAARVSERPLGELEQLVLQGTFDLAISIQPADDPLLATEPYRRAISPWFDTLAAAAAAEPGRPGQRALYAELQRLWQAEFAALPLYQELKVDVVSTRLEGVRPAAHRAPVTWNVAEWRRVKPG